MMSLEPTSDQSQCLNCGTHVSQSYRRAFGDENRRAHRCPACDTRERVYKGSAAGVDVDVPDPAGTNRNRGQRVGAQMRADGGVDEEDEWNPEPTDLREGETDDEMGHAARNAAQLALADEDDSEEDEGGDGE